MTKTTKELIGLLRQMADCLECGDDELADRCGIELAEELEGIASVEEIVAYLRKQAELRAPENDVAGILLKYAYHIELDNDELEGKPLPFAGLDADQTE